MVTRRVLSTEDGNLQKSVLISSRSVDYVDIDLAFANRPSGDVYKKRDAAAVKQSIKNILLTNHYEKPFQPFFGSNLRGMLFELADNLSTSEVKSNIITAIKSYEPRVEILNLDVNIIPDQNDMRISIVFKIISIEEIVTFTTNLSRLR
jgi:phage baseplate assembly protein W|tara:strand:+ start:3953 stop:4399 length:447 start_codon:yes stop_codon:yes gene_type:complete